ncbi:MAG: SdpI family protein [Chitinophagales bacterium]|nr:SdpI family protein [Chitinophagales bacterium]
MDILENIILQPFIFIPLISTPFFIIMAVVMLFYPPKTIGLIGYRTPRSMENGQEVWDFAQKYSAKQFLLFQTIYLFTTVLTFIHFSNPVYAWLLAIALNIIFAIIPIITTERKLKSKFTK